MLYGSCIATHCYEYAIQICTKKYETKSPVHFRYNVENHVFQLDVLFSILQIPYCINNEGLYGFRSCNNIINLTIVLNLYHQPN